MKGPAARRAKGAEVWKPGFTDWAFCTVFSMVLSSVAAVFCVKTLLDPSDFGPQRPHAVRVRIEPTAPPLVEPVLVTAPVSTTTTWTSWTSTRTSDTQPFQAPQVARAPLHPDRRSLQPAKDANCQVEIPKLAAELAKGLRSPKDQAALDLAAEAWKRLLAGKIQVAYMRQRMCSRMKNWLETLTQISWMPQGRVRSVMVWPQAAYLHFGVTRVWSLGEYAQWADLCAALATLGLEVTLWPFQRKTYPTVRHYQSVQIVYTDYNGVHAGKGSNALPPPDKTWLLDTFGTDGTVVDNDFFGRVPPLTDYPLHRFLTLAPGYSSRNTFLGVAAVAGRSDNTSIASLPPRTWQCVLWSKVHPWLAESNGFPAYHANLLHEYTKHCKVIATVDAKDTYKTSQLIRTCCPEVEIRDVQSPQQFQSLLRSSAVYVGVGEPLIAPSCFEALSLGTHVVQPHFPEHRTLKNKPTTENWTSQHPFLEQVPEPFAFTVNPLDLEALTSTFRSLRRAFDSIYGVNQAVPKAEASEVSALRAFYAFGEYPGRDEFSTRGFLKRVAGTVEGTRTLEAADWDWERQRHPMQLPSRALGW